MTKPEEKVLEAVRKIGMPQLNQWKYRHDTVMGEFARAVIELKTAEGLATDSIPKGRLVPR